MLDPNTWINIADRLGIPTALLFMIFFMVFYALKWSANNIVKPLVTEHLATLESVKNNTSLTAKSQIEILSNQKNQSGKLDKICNAIDSQTIQLKDAFNGKH